MVTMIICFYCHFKFWIFSEIYFCIYSTLINNNFSAYTKSQALSYSNLLTSRIFSYLNTFNVLFSLQQTLLENKPFPWRGLLQKLPVIVSGPKLSNQQLWHYDNGVSGFIEHVRLLLQPQWSQLRQSDSFSCEYPELQT